MQSNIDATFTYCNKMIKYTLLILQLLLLNYTLHAQSVNFNHITVENDSVIFEYNGVKLKINGISEIPTQFAKETITSSIKNDVVFKSALTQFLRDKKINEILE